MNVDEENITVSPLKGRKRWLKLAEYFVIGTILALNSMIVIDYFSRPKQTIDVQKVMEVLDILKSLEDKSNITVFGYLPNGTYISGNNNEPDKEILPRRIRIPEKGYLLIFGSAKGKFDSGLKKGTLGMVTAKICIDGIECTQDVSAIRICKNEKISVSLAATAIFGKVLEKGDYDLSVIGVFDGGCIINPKTSMGFMVVKFSAMPPDIIKKLDTQISK